MKPLEVCTVDCEAPEVVARLAIYREVLSSEERQRIDRFLRPGDQRAHLVSTALLRWGLGRSLGVDGKSLRLEPGSHGKPTLTFPTAEVAFNASQSGQFAVAAFAPGGSVGVDVERIDERLDVMANAEGSFSPDEQALLTRAPEDERRALFFRLWTLKEAYAKALGTGLSTAFQEFTVRFGQGGEARIDGDAKGWWLSSVKVAEGYAGAVAFLAEGGRPTLEIRRVIPFEEWGGDGQAAR